tara:strand:- start:1402 stop:2196 length:795 start_codon:yes stop_codon:yes gene_type:complete
MDLGIDNRFAIVCASTKGLGFAIAQSLLAEGAKVVICSSKKENLDNASELLDDQGYKEKYFPCLVDLSTPEGVTSLFEFSLSHSATIDILVNNCGGPNPGSVSDINEHQLDDAINKNLRNTFNLTKLILPVMKTNNWGRIVNITSSSAKQPIDGLLLSNITRAAVTAFSKSVSNEYARYNIMVNNVLPGRIVTDRIIELATNKATETGTKIEKILETMGDDLPIARLGKPEEFAPIVTFLCSEMASYITGNSVHIDGGLIKSLF